MIICKIKVKRHEYEITEKDRFMDNGSCIQLITQTKEFGPWGKKYSPLLSKRVIKEISIFERVQHGHKYGNGITIFSLK